MAQHAADNLAQVRQACATLTGRSGLGDISDAVAYFTDTFATLAATLAALPPLATVMLNGRTPALLREAAHIHNSVVPRLRTVLQSVPAAAKSAGTAAQLALVSLLIARTVSLLLAHGILQPGGASTSQGSGGMDAATAAGDRLVHLLMELQVWPTQKARSHV